MIDFLRGLGLVLFVVACGIFLAAGAYLIRGLTGVDLDDDQHLPEA